MARLYEYQSKRLLKDGGIRVPEGGVAATPAEARALAEKIGRPVVLKIQVWVTGRAGLGGIQFAATPDEAEAKAAALLGMKVRNYVVDRILVEERLSIKEEYFAGLVLDDAAKRPVLVFSPVGGTGVEEIARLHPEKIVRLPIDVGSGLEEYEARNLILPTGLAGTALTQVSDLLARLYKVARGIDARSAEINPLVLTDDGRLYAADCHLVVDDYAVFRHPELGIEIAREFDRPPTELERIAYKVEEKDYRGTFYFFQMAETTSPDGTFIGFHGAGGGGSMMSMDAVLGPGLQAGQLLRHERQPAGEQGLPGGQDHPLPARHPGLFRLGIGRRQPGAVPFRPRPDQGFYRGKARHPGGHPSRREFRGGGDPHPGRLRPGPARPDRGVRTGRPAGILRRPARRSHPRERGPRLDRPADPAFREPEGAYAFATMTGKLFIRREKCAACKTKGCVPACAHKVLKLEDGAPVLAIPPEDARKGKCTECLACEIFCRFHELDAILIHLPIPGLAEYREKAGRS